MNRSYLSAMVTAALGLAAPTARAQAPAARPAAVRYVQAPAGYYYSNGYYYRSAPAYAAPSPGSGTVYYSYPNGYTRHNGVLRGPSGAMSGRPSQNFDPTGRGVQLYKPWLQPLR